MKIIAHRGNRYGPTPRLENWPTFLYQALREGFDIEVDIWFHQNQWYTGHDNPQYPVRTYAEFPSSRTWFHAKNLAALERLTLDEKVNVFWHDSDRYTITSRGYIWAAPGQPLGFADRTIDVLPERSGYGGIGPISLSTYGVCTDFASELRDLVTETLKD